MSAVVGIDLGTTNTVVAAVRHGRATTLADDAGERLIPSVVAFFPNGTVSVGRVAKRRRLQDATNTVYSTKRLIGRSFDSEEVRKARARAAFSIKEGTGNSVVVAARGESYTLSEISGFVLKEAKRVAEAELGMTVDRAVVTVPANFNDLQRGATKVAAHIADIEVLRILNEPTAAALAYGYGKGSHERIAVYDFGGGTFDVTLLDLTGNVFEVLATAGDTFLGGDDIDLAIAERMAERFLKTHRYDARADRQIFERIISVAEELKVRLSAAERASVLLPEVAYGPGGKPLDMSISMTRAELAEIAQPFVERTINVCQEAMGIARLAPDGFDQVILVGGATRVPLVRQRVEELFGRAPMDQVSADEVVALGAAIQASALAGSRQDHSTLREPRTMLIQENPGHGRPLMLGTVGVDAVSVPPAALTSGRSAHTNVGSGSAAARLHEFSSRDRKAPERLLARGESSRKRRPKTRTPRGAAAAVVPGGSVVLGGQVADPGTSQHKPETAAGQTPPMPRETAAARSPVLFERPATPATDEQADRVLAAWQSPVKSPVNLETDVLQAHAIQPLPPVAMPVVSEVDPHIASAIEAVPMPPLDTASVVPPVVALVDAVPEHASAPLLIDVTPLSLAVETVGGFCDVIIERNTPIPSERTRLFATASDNQTQVRVAVAQGESKRFSENAYLGQLELFGLRAAGRGEVAIAVTFEIDADGILNVRAADKSTGKEARARMRLSGAVPAGKDVDAMKARLGRMV